MLSPENSQVEICLLKSSLEEIEHELIAQRTVWPSLDAENEQKFRESLNAVKVSRSLSGEIEQLNQENVRLVAKRMHLKMKSEEITKALQKARDEYTDMEKELNDENKDTELLIRKYEDLLREKTAQFRESRACFDQTQMKLEIEKVQESAGGLKEELEGRRARVESLKKELGNLAGAVPEDLLLIFGKPELLEKVKSLSEKCDALQEKRDAIVQKRNSISTVLNK